MGIEITEDEYRLLHILIKIRNSCHLESTAYAEVSLLNTFKTINPGPNNGEEQIPKNTMIESLLGIPEEEFDEAYRIYTSD